MPTSRQIGTYVRDCARILNVGSPRIVIRHKAKLEDAGGEAYARVTYTNADRVNFWYTDRLLKCGHRMWRVTVAHELMHMHLRHFYLPFMRVAKKADGGWLEWYDATEEEIVERLETVLAKLLPDPPWPE